VTTVDPSVERHIRFLCDRGGTLVEVYPIGEGSAKKDGKQPVGNGWQNRGPVTAEDVLGWLSRGRNYGLLPWTAGVAVLDIEPAGQELFPIPPEGLVVQSPSGGSHVYMDLEVVERVLERQLGKEQLDNQAELFGRTGQVLGPGSRAITGKGGPRREGNYRVLRHGEPTRDEAVIRELLRPFIKRAGDRGARYVKATLEGAASDVASASEGTRNSALNAKSYKLGRLGAPEAETKERLVAAATEAGLPEREARRTADSGYEAGRKNPRSVPTGERSTPTNVPRPKRERKPRRKESLHPYTPFPTHALPEPVRSFVEAASRAIGCAAAYVALPLLSALASAIGNARRIRLKRGWVEPMIIWTAIVGESGSLKSPGLDAAVRPIRDLQGEAMREFEEEKKQYKIDKALYDKDFADWKKRKDGSDPPEEPAEPVPRRYYCSDITVEALAVAHQEQWRGLFIIRDELSGWVGSHNQYKNGRGDDTAHWLEMHGGRPLFVERKTATPKYVYVPYSCVSIAGGIQPQTLKRALGREHFEDGIAARIFMAYPPRREKTWTEAEVPVELHTAIELILKELYALQPSVGEDGEPRPQLVDLSPEGKREWVAFFNEHGVEQADLSGDLAAAWSKLEGGAARLALLFHLVRQANREPGIGGAVDAKSVAAGVTAARWFAQEAKRIYAILGEDEGEEDVRQRVEMIERKGGRVTVREWQRARGLDTAEEAEGELDELVEQKLGAWEQTPPGPKGGRPTRTFVLAPDTTPSPKDKTPPDDSARGVSSASVVSCEGEGDLEGVSGSVRPGAGGAPPSLLPGMSVEEESSDTTDADTTPLAAPRDGVSSPDEGVVSDRPEPEDGGWLEI